MTGGPSAAFYRGNWMKMNKQKTQHRWRKAATGLLALLLSAALVYVLPLVLFLTVYLLASALGGRPLLPSAAAFAAAAGATAFPATTRIRPASSREPALTSSSFAFIEGLLSVAARRTGGWA